jgi:hypothetical protein
MADEPRVHRWYVILLAATALGSVPFPFVGRSQIMFLGLPLWLWWSSFFTFGLSAVTAWGVLRYWRSDDE